MTNVEPSIVAEVGLLIYRDCQLSAIYGLTDLFRIASDWAESDAGRNVRVTHWRSDGEGPPDCIWDTHPGEAHRLDYIITPPSIVMPERMEPMRVEADWLRRQHGSGSRVCSICAGAFVLAESGLLQGRRVTTHWAFAKQLALRYGDIDVADQNLVLDDGDIISAGGIIAWTDLGLTLVERLFGRAVMLSTARFLVIAPPRSTQRPYMEFVPEFSHGDKAILRAQHHIHANLARELTLAGLAKVSILGRRTFIRRFAKATGLNPTEYIQHARMAQARGALELTNRPMEQIAGEAGYSDPSSFNKIFQRICGVSATVYRQQFGLSQVHEKPALKTC